jgi:hydroxymethylglutaryl-CoA lyase
MKIIEMPREGMQSLDFTIPTEKKVRYIQHLLNVGFDTVEIGSIVSQKLIPQMADSLEVLHQLDFSSTTSNRMMLAVSKKGADILAEEKEITYISYPHSISPTFLKHNLNATTEQSLDTVNYIANLCARKDKHLIVYISMAFGNPYGDPWNPKILLQGIKDLEQAGVKVMPLSNVAIEINEHQIRDIFNLVISEFTRVEFGLHLHTTNENWHENVLAAYESGVRRFDSVINGFGGCPMTGKEMLGNLKTENLIEFAKEKGQAGTLDAEALDEAYKLAGVTFMEPIKISVNPKIKKKS